MISRNAGNIAIGASTTLNRVSTLVNYGYGEELDNDLRSSFANPRNIIQEEYINEEDGILNRKGGRFKQSKQFKQSI